MSHFTVVYSSDLHGNITQYEKLVAYAADIFADALVLGGDLTPNGGGDGVGQIQNQRQFLEHTLPDLLWHYQRKVPRGKTYLILGNDDAKANEDVLKAYDPSVAMLVHEHRRPLDNDIEIIGYSYVPITPFWIKDWEKYDLSDVPLEYEAIYTSLKQAHRRDGVKSSSSGWNFFSFGTKDEANDSIQQDLEKEIFTANAHRTVYLFHNPPYGTNLDCVSKTRHVGSIAKRLFITRHQPYLTLQGHIHETVKMSGQFKDSIGHTTCLSSGNHNIGEFVSVLMFDLYAPQDAVRLIL